METITKKISAELKNKVAKDFLPLARELRASGKTDREIEAIIISHIKCKTKTMYDENKQFKSISQVLAETFGIIGDCGPDSKIEEMFRNTLNQIGIDHKFHYRIGPYVADFLIDEDIVVELDGPQHGDQLARARDKKRDLYMQKLGYHVLRIPTLYFILDEYAVMQAIIDVMKMKMAMEARPEYTVIPHGV